MPPQFLVSLDRTLFLIATLSGGTGEFGLIAIGLFRLVSSLLQIRDEEE
jgi:hypothetical protein